MIDMEKVEEEARNGFRPSIESILRICDRVTILKCKNTLLKEACQAVVDVATYTEPLSIEVAVIQARKLCADVLLP